MPIALADLLHEQQVILRLRSRKPANAIREIVDVLASDISGRKIAKPEAFLKEVNLIFVIGVPERLLSDYLVCVGTLARLVKDETIRSRLLNAETPREFIEALTADTL